MALAVVQSKGATGNNTAPTVSGMSACGAGNMIIAGLWTPDLISGITYTGWTVDVNDDDSGSTHSVSLMRKVASGGETSFSLSISPSAQWNMAVIEVSGQDASPLDKNPALTATGDPTGTGTTCQSEPTGTLSQAAEIVVSALAVTAGISGVSESGIGLNIVTGTIRLQLGYLIVASTASLQASWLWTSAGQRNCAIATYKEAAGAPTGQPLMLRYGGPRVPFAGLGQTPVNRGW